MSVHDEIDEARAQAEADARSYGGRKVAAGDLFDQNEVAVLLGVAESSLRAMRAQPERHRKIDGLPAPIRNIGTSPVWDAGQVLAWLRAKRGYAYTDEPGGPDA